MELAEAQLLACVLSQPELLLELDLDETPLQVPAVQTLVEWAVEGQAIGRTGGAELFRYMFSRASDQPELMSMLALAQDRADKMSDAGEVLRGIVAGRRRVTAQAQLRDLRHQLSQAMRAGDAAAAAALQQQVLEMMRRDRPRSSQDAPDRPAPAAKRPLPSFLTGRATSGDEGTTSSRDVDSGDASEGGST